jgi:hypothetical protein
MARVEWMMAAWLVAEHGADAPQIVHRTIMGLRRELADKDRVARWLLIDAAVTEWLRLRPKIGDTFH